MNQSDTAVMKAADDSADDGEPSSTSGTTALVPFQEGGKAVAPAVVQRKGWLARLLALKDRRASSLRDDLSDALSIDAKALHAFSAEEKRMLHSILRLKDLRVEDLMVPRADIEAVELNIVLGELLKLFEDSGHSRMPVYAETLDDPRGMVHIRDVVAYITRTAALSKAEAAARKRQPAANLDLKKVSLERPLGSLKIIRKVLFVPPSMRAADLLARMQASRTQMALVIDEYGGTEESSRWRISSRSSLAISRTSMTTRKRR